MATKPLSSDAIALTEKKMDMSLDEIIKLSKTRGIKQKKQRVSNKGQKSFDKASQDKGLKVKRFMDSRASLRQGALAQRRSNFQGNNFPLATEAAKKAAVTPMGSRAFNSNRVFNVNKSRVVVTSFQKNTTAGVGFIMKKPLQKPVQEASLGPKQKHQTLDSLFANMKEERMRGTSQRSKGSRRNGVRQHGLPWVRGFRQNC